MLTKFIATGSGTRMPTTSLLPLVLQIDAGPFSTFALGQASFTDN